MGEVQLIGKFESLKSAYLHSMYSIMPWDIPTECQPSGLSNQHVGGCQASG